MFEEVKGLLMGISLKNLLNNQIMNIFIKVLKQRRPTQMRSRAAFSKNLLIKGQIFE
jgi:hypothetical protein